MSERVAEPPAATPPPASAADLLVHQRARVCGYSDDCFAQKFMCMGVRPGSSVELVRKAAWGRACYFEVDGRRLAVRREEAACLLIQRMADALQEE